MGFGIIIYFDVYFSKVDPLVESDEIQVAERIKRRCKCYCFNKVVYTGSYCHSLYVLKQLLSNILEIWKNYCTG